ncbi:hypothetical protein DAERI_070026 [Deinococcus aerius]|uniref:Fibronectin type-III domain-containing protein n=1 Tax=Deinococcus aerius TaxID=200253 RepID=A0A2I9DIE9_9DEIO|nr:fibronectin type III domain-containing protein [Deinococcus aerius]GBF06028.1 hypothetical protein DAERI_070026 [Deinococcus aerius]
MNKTTKMTLGLLLVTLSLASCGGGSPAPATLPDNPATFTATATNSTTALLNWSAVSGASNFTLERKTNGGAYATVAANLGANTYTDTALTPNTSYTYRLKAVNSAGSSSGVERTVTTPAPGDPDFTLSAPRSVTIQSGKSGTVDLTITRPQNPEGTVALSLEGPDVGSGAGKIAGTFGGANGTTLTLSVGADVAVGPHTVTVRGKNGAVEKTAQIIVNVERWLLVDDDRSSNNWPANDPNKPDSNADTFSRAAMQASGKTFEVKVVPYSGSGQDKDEPNGPSAQELSRYSGVIWYTGGTIVHPITDTDRAELAAFLNTANRKLILLSPGFVRDGATNGGTLAAPGTAYQPLVTGLLGIDKVAFPGSAAFTLTGEANTVMGGITVNVASSVRGFLQPGAGAQALLREGTNVVAAGKANIGATSTSRAVLGAFSLGHLAQGDAVTVLQKLLHY